MNRLVPVVARNIDKLALFKTLDELAGEIGMTAEGLKLALLRHGIDFRSVRERVLARYCLKNIKRLKEKEIARRLKIGPKTVRKYLAIGKTINHKGTKIQTLKG